MARHSASELVLHPFVQRQTISNFIPWSRRTSTSKASWATRRCSESNSIPSVHYHMVGFEQNIDEYSVTSADIIRDWYYRAKENPNYCVSDAIAAFPTPLYEYDQEYVRAVACYEAQDESELCMIEDEMLLVITKQEEGWWYVSNNHNQEGWIPCTFVEPSLPTAYVRVLQDYEQDEIEQFLPIHEDDFIEITQYKPCSSGWLFGRNQCSQWGWFPASYVEWSTHQAYLDSIDTITSNDVDSLLTFIGIPT